MKPCENRMLLSLGESDWRSMFWHLSFPWLPQVSFYVDPPHRMSIQDSLVTQLQRNSTWGTRTKCRSRQKRTYCCKLIHRLV